MYNYGIKEILTLPSHKIVLCHWIKTGFFQCFSFQFFHFCSVFESTKMQASVNKQMRDSLARGNAKGFCFALRLPDVQEYLALIFSERK